MKTSGMLSSAVKVSLVFQQAAVVVHLWELAVEHSLVVMADCIVSLVVAELDSDEAVGSWLDMMTGARKRVWMQHSG